MDGGTFTISNGGVFGSLFGTPIINPPQSAILGMHGVFERPVVRNGQVCFYICSISITHTFSCNVLIHEVRFFCHYFVSSSFFTVNRSQTEYRNFHTKEFSFSIFFPLLLCMYGRFILVLTEWL